MRSGGFTLIELLVVISIMALLAVFAFVNFKDFAQDQVLNKAAGEVQTYLRLAQSNATSSTLCNNQGAASWFLIFNSTTIELRCNPENYLQRTYSLENALIAISGSGCTLNLPATLSYLVGTAELSGACTSVTFTVSNIQNPALTKNITVSKGGAIDVE